MSAKVLPITGTKLYSMPKGPATVLQIGPRAEQVTLNKISALAKKLVRRFSFLNPDKTIPGVVSDLLKASPGHQAVYEVFANHGAKLSKRSLNTIKQISNNLRSLHAGRYSESHGLDLQASRVRRDPRGWTPMFTLLYRDQIKPSTAYSDSRLNKIWQDAIDNLDHDVPIGRKEKMLFFLNWLYKEYFPRMEKLVERDKLTNDLKFEDVHKELMPALSLVEDVDFDVSRFGHLGMSMETRHLRAINQAVSEIALSNGVYFDFDDSQSREHYVGLGICANPDMKAIPAITTSTSKQPPQLRQIAVFQTSNPFGDYSDGYAQNTGYYIVQDVKGARSRESLANSRLLFLADQCIGAKLSPAERQANEYRQLLHSNFGEGNDIFALIEAAIRRDLELKLGKRILDSKEDRRRLYQHGLKENTSFMHGIRNAKDVKRADARRHMAHQVKIAALSTAVSPQTLDTFFRVSIPVLQGELGTYMEPNPDGELRSGLVPVTLSFLENSNANLDYVNLPWLLRDLNSLGNINRKTVLGVLFHHGVVRDVNNKEGTHFKEADLIEILRVLRNTKVPKGEKQELFCSRPASQRYLGLLSSRLAGELNTRYAKKAYPLISELGPLASKLRRSDGGVNGIEFNNFVREAVSKDTLGDTISAVGEFQRLLQSTALTTALQYFNLAETSEGTYDRLVDWRLYNASRRTAQVDVS